MTARSSRRPACDLEEVAPGHFVVHNQQLRGLLKDDGTLNGRFFELTTWRRDGFLARLRGREYNVRTLEDAIETLPKPPRAPRPGPLLWRQTGEHERVSWFDPQALGWRVLPTETRNGAVGVVLGNGWAIRRRKGRGGPASYAISNTRRGTAELDPSDETSATLAGYAVALAQDDRPLIVEQIDKGFRLPAIELPPPYRSILGKLTTPDEAGPLTDQRSWPLVRQLFQRLGIELRVDERHA